VFKPALYESLYADTLASKSYPRHDRLVKQALKLLELNVVKLDVSDVAVMCVLHA
jgi:hypothetical protein